MVLETVLGVKLTFIFGIVNVIGLALVLLSCRCLLGNSITKKLWQYGWYKKFYSKHCYYWWLFIISVLIHAALGFLVFGNPL